MITLDDLKKASEKLDKMYAEEVYPRILAFREAWDKMSAPFLDENARRVARRHGIEFMPSNELAEKICFLCAISRSVLGTTSKCTASYERIRVFNILSYNNGAEPCPTMIEATGHNNCFGAWGHNLWGVIKGNAWLLDKPQMDKIQDFLVQWRKNLQTTLEQFRWFAENIGNVSKEIEAKANEIAELDAEDTDKFHALFDIRPTLKKVKITVLIEEI